MLEGVAPDAAPRPGLEIVANYDAMQKNARFGKPLKLAGKAYSRGLFCHAPSKIVVRLPGPGKTFEAQVGLDSNEQTSGGRGSVVFSVEVGAKEAFRSAVLREGMPPATVHVDLGGAAEFVLQVGDGGDGIACDQADWADARITLADGRIPLAGRAADARAGRRSSKSAVPASRSPTGGSRRRQLLPTWKVERTSKKLDERRTQRTIVYTDPKTGLVVRCVAIEYHDFPTVEWTLYFKNSGRPPRRSWRTSRRWTCGSPAATTASSSCTTRWAAPAR